MLPLSVLDAALAAVGCAATLVVVDECIMASAGRYSMHSIGSQEAGIARESNVILLYHMQTQHINFLHFVPTLLLLDTTSAVTSGCQTTLLGLLGETYAPFLCEPPHLDGHLRGLLAGGQPDSQPQLPSFCQSISGACNEDGEAEGYCEAVLAYQSVRICGQWVEGHPCGPITITPLEGGFAFQLDTLPPTAADYASNPSLIAEGYLWPTPSLANGGRRLLKLSATYDEDQQRSYCVDMDRSASTNSVSDVCNPDVLWHIRLRCIDEEPACVAERRLPPMVSRVVLNMGIARGDHATICLVHHPTVVQSVVYSGAVFGDSHQPFARHGLGTLIYPMGLPGHHWRQRQHYTVSASLLGAEWRVGQCIVGADGSAGQMIRCETGGFEWRAAVVVETTKPSKILLRRAIECMLCGTVISANTKHDCEGSAHRSRDTLHTLRATPPPQGGNKTNVASHSKANVPDVVCLGIENDILGCLVRQEITFDSCEPGSGGGGHYPCFVGFDLTGDSRHMCAAKICQNTLQCRVERLCPHIRLVQRHIIGWDKATVGTMRYACCTSPCMYRL